MFSFINHLLGKHRKAKMPSNPHPLPDFSKYDPEYIAYCIEQEQTVSHLEARLHESDDPKKIATLTLKTVCDFYGADWAGILDVDLDLDIWTPLWWHNTHSHDHTMELFQEYDIAKSVPNWAKALKEGTPVIIPDMKAVQAEHPKEYEITSTCGLSRSWVFRSVRIRSDSLLSEIQSGISNIPARWGHSPMCCIVRWHSRKPLTAPS